MIGKLKQKLKETCVDCGGKLELRSVEKKYLQEGEEFSTFVDIKYCKVCDDFVGKENVKQSKPWKRHNIPIE